MEIALDATVGLARGDFFLIVAALALPIAALAFIAVGPLLRGLGKGRFGLQMERPPPGSPGPLSAKSREAEVRQMLEAKAYRQRSRGERPLDVDREVRRLLESTPATATADRGLVDEIRQLVVARNERRIRRGEEPLDVDAEVERQLRDLEDLGQ